MPVAKEKNSCHWSHKMYNYESSEAANSYILFSLIKRTVHWKKKKSVLKKAKQEFEKKKKIPDLLSVKNIWRYFWLKLKVKMRNIPDQKHSDEGEKKSFSRKS